MTAILRAWRREYEAGSTHLLWSAWTLALVCSLWLITLTPVFSQESYYWLYGKNPALSYFDHPPMVGWLIHLATSVLGDGVIGLRSTAFLSALGVTGIGMDLLRRMGGSARSQVLWVLFSIAVPAFAMTHFLMLPDAPLLFFWTLTIYTLWRARETAELPWWIAAGASAGCAMLSKYTAAFLLPGGILILAFDPEMRKQLRKPGPWIALLIASLCFLPVLIWNAANDWASFSFQTTSRYEAVRLQTHWLIQFILGQAGILLPLAILFWSSIPWLLNRLTAGSKRALWLASFSLPLFGFMLMNSLVIHVKINWALPAYVTSTLAVCLWMDRCRIDQRSPRLFNFAIVSAITMAALSLLAPLAAYVPQRGNVNWTGWPHIARRAEHWEHLLDSENGVEGDIFFFCENYRDSSQLTRNLFIHIPQWNKTEVVAAQNVFGNKALEFDNWSNLKDKAGRDAIFVLTNPKKRQWAVDMARTLFRSIRCEERIVIQRLGRTVLTAEIYSCRDYAGT